jgi:hypothetical protein
MKNLTRVPIVRYCSFSIFLFLLFSNLTLTSQSQSFWLPDTSYNAGHGMCLEILKPFFDDNDDISFLTSTQNLSGRYQVSHKIFLVAELPFAHFNSDFSDSEFSIGNPYLGFVRHKAGQPYFLEVGIRAPLASDEKFNALFVGLFTDYDKAEAYVPDLLTVSIKGTYVKKYNSNFMLRLSGGPTIWQATKDNTIEDDTEALLDYSGHVGYDGSKVRIMGGITGRLVVTESDIDIQERTIHHFGLFGRYKSKNVQPGLLLKIPIDEDLNDIFNFSIGVNLLVNLN